MTSESVESLLAHQMLERHPSEASEHLESLAGDAAAELVSEIRAETGAKVFRTLATDCALEILSRASPNCAGQLLVHMAPSQAGTLLIGIPEPKREAILASLSTADANDLRRLMEYPAETAGRLRDPDIAVFRKTTTVRQALQRLSGFHGRRTVANCFVVDDDGQLVGVVPLQEAALAEPSATLTSLVEGPPISVSAFASRAEVVETMERRRMTSLPVVSSEGLPIGVLRLHELMQEVGKELSADLVSVTGASKDETALSSVAFSVRKRLPWLQVNLLTAFLAASVVGIFEETIAQFTALAVLLPVVAGQSGNTGSQALAVVLRGLAVREVTLRSWPRIARKELLTGVLNGFGVSAVTCVGVYLWSGSTGLVLVIGTAMIVSMAIAGIAGAVIPVVLAALGQDPAQSSSILLTTVTDVVGFFSFLGLATLFAGLL